MNSLSLAFDGPVSRASPSAEAQFSQMNYRSEVFALFFLSLTISPIFAPRLYRLSIENLQSQREPRVTTTPGFLELIRDISTLELGIHTLADYMSSPRTREMSIETWSFYSELPQVWLAPASQFLEKLHLSADGPWGWYPKVDLRGVYVPHLRDLALIRYTFSHDWQLQWLSDHAGSLERLVLTKCAILDNATSTNHYFDSEGYPYDVEYEKIYPLVKGSHVHKKRWSHYFKAIADSLPNLGSFSILDHDQPKLLDQEAAQISRARYHSVLDQRYLKYRSGDYLSLFGHPHGTYEEARTFMRREGEMTQQDEEDERALRELLAAIQRRNSTRPY